LNATQQLLIGASYNADVESIKLRSEGMSVIKGAAAEV